MGGQQSRGGEGGESEQDKKDKKAKKYEAPAPTRVGKKKKKKAGPPQSARVPTINPTAKCKLRLLKMERVKDYLLLEEEFVLRQEQVKPQEESAQKERTKVEDIRGSPMNVASLEEMIDDNHAIVASNVGPEYYVNIMSFVDKDQLEPGCSLLTHYRVNSIVGLLADEQDPMVSVMKVDKAPTESYADIGGLEQQIMEMKEAVELPLTHPELYEDIGIRPPKGVILYGEPGTGKTLLAKAVANQTSATFLRVTGSELIQKYLGDGPRLVRELFRVADEQAPTIVFIDEIDAVGRQRGAGMGGGNDEREQTINQLLTEMDGFEGNTGVIVLAATNRPDVLDSALLRPGRFDRQVTVDLPDVAGRIRILKVHARDKTIGKDVDYDKVARRTPGFSGAALQNLLNEAAILAARRELTEISKEEIADALERIVAGAAKEGAVMSEQKKKLVAYHEAGHAIVGALMPEYDPVTKISIVPRGAAGGLTFFAPSEERLESGLYSRSYLENQMAVAMGGRVAEELIFGAENVTTGASGDFQQVSNTARMMVEQMGFSEKIGQIALKTGGGGSFLGNDAGRAADYSQTTANLVDAEVKELVETAYRRAKDLVTENIGCLHAVADVLLDKENIDGDEFEKIMLAAKAKLYLKEDNESIEVPFKTA